MSNIDPFHPSQHLFLLLFLSYTFSLLYSLSFFSSSSQQLFMVSFSSQVTFTHTHTLLRLHCHLFSRAFCFSPSIEESISVTSLAAIFIGITASLVLTGTLLTLLARLRRRKVKKGSFYSHKQRDKEETKQ